MFPTKSFSELPLFMLEHAKLYLESAGVLKRSGCKDDKKQVALTLGDGKPKPILRGSGYLGYVDRITRVIFSL